MLDDNGIRPPLIAAGINLFGGPLGLIHRHVTGAIPIRRNTKDPAYLITLKAYVAEMLKKHDLFFYPGGRPQLQRRAEAGQDRADPRGAARPSCPNLVIVPVAIAYDLVLEDHILARQRVKKQQRPFTRELAEMVRYAVGYRSRAFVTFGAPIPVGRLRPALAQRRARARRGSVRARIGALYKVLPTARLRRGDAAVDHAARPRSAHRQPHRGTGGAAREPRRHERAAGRRGGGRAARDAAASSSLERGRFRVRERSVLRYYARTIEHLLVTPGRTH